MNLTDILIHNAYGLWGRSSGLRQYARRYGFLFADFEEVTDNLVTSIHTDIVVIANLSVFHLNYL